MGHPYWPLFDLRLRTERLELGWPDDDDCTQLAALAAKGIHPPDFMPFQMPWTRQPSPQLERGAMQGDDLQVVEGEARRQIRLKISRKQWEAHRKYDVEISGLEPCLELFGAAPPSEPDPDS